MTGRYALDGQRRDTWTRRRGNLAEGLLAFLDGVQHLSWRAGVRFQWPCWLLDWAWSRQAHADARYWPAYLPAPARLVGLGQDAGPETPRRASGRSGPATVPNPMTPAAAPPAQPAAATTRPPGGAAPAALAGAAPPSARPGQPPRNVPAGMPGGPHHRPRGGAGSVPRPGLPHGPGQAPGNWRETREWEVIADPPVVRGWFLAHLVRHPEMVPGATLDELARDLQAWMARTGAAA